METLLNGMIQHSQTYGLSMVVVGSRKHIVPRVIVGIDQNENEIGEFGSARQHISFPYFLYLLSSLILGLTMSWLLCAICRQKTNAHIVIHAHDPVIGAMLFLPPSRIFRSATYVIQFHSENTKRLALMLPRTLMTKPTLILYSFLEKICVFRADRVIAVNEGIYNYLVETGCPPHKITRIPVFLNPLFVNVDSAELERTRRNLDIDRGHFVLTYVGRVSKEKNLGTLIKAFLDLDISIRKNLRLLIVGEGEQLKILKSSIHISDGVLFLGHRTDIGRILSLSDVFVLPSLIEGFPLSLLEAMSFGKAIIASNIPAIREILNAEEAILFDPKNPLQLKEAMLRFYSDSGLRKELGENAKKKASKYDVDDVYPRILQVYHESFSTR